MPFEICNTISNTINYSALSDDQTLTQVYRGKEAIAALVLGLSPRVPKERWLQAALIRHFPEAVAVLKVTGKGHKPGAGRNWGRFVCLFFI